MTHEKNWSRREVLGLLLALPFAGLANAAVTGPLDRPAIVVRDGRRAVLLGAAMAGPQVVAVGEHGLVLLSDDRGESWRQSPVPVSVTLTAVRFADATHGVVVGHGGVVLVTADAGASWSLVFDGRRAAALALAAAGGDPVAQRHAERLVADGPDEPFLDVLMVGPQRIIAVGAYGLAYASGDGGKSWTPWMARLDNPGGSYCYALRRRGKSIVIAGEQGLLLRSDDDGATFRRLQSPYQGSFFALELPGERDIVLAGLRGNAWISHDDGQVWSQLAVPGKASITASLALADGTVLFGDQSGGVLRLVGDRLQPVNQAALPSINALVTTGPGHLLALTMQGVLPLEA